ncbi:hypothetical protein, variant 2 [Phytophthora nicotianae INRA-310]|uniref:Myb-like domain-containing protein n=3 Tax=Phytophthora nicotianae TaxID=4792 RepID=W2RIB8_PHYN3|nr:hypothetical protein, variant 2 [Phytophthora nicotianae INRA-310]ETI56050.1 hypothetical protein, variant 2 [Phytophthora nicotianae P1569]ETM55541.1 hypothetical protein, variant 2 [Phytophthora nicotianae]ETN24971.1 hypothetical protein, variant 2 [Phytophthora nicotianae INRA-310]
MREALEACGEFLSRIGALEGANAIAEILHKMGEELSESSPFRWRALFAAIRQELEADPMDVVFLFERLLQLNATMPSGPSQALFNSPLFFHLLVERFAVAFEGLDAELFKLESDELCHAEGIYETCVLIQDKIEESDTESGLKKFLATFKRIFEQDEPKDCWEAFRELYHLNDASFRRDMTRALCMIESVTLGPTKLELAFPTKAPEGPKIIVPRALLEKRFGGTRREWRDLSQFNSLPGADIGQIANNESQQQQQGHEQTQEQEQEQHIPDPSNSVNGESTESVHSDISEEEPEERPASSRPPRTAEVARAARQEGRRAVPRRRMTREESIAIVNPVPNERQGGRRKRVRWSEEEEAALIMGYRLYESYSNVWVLIKSKFPEVLRHRSNVDLKDKYRNLVRYGKIPQANDTGATDNDATDDNAGPEDHN